MSRPNHNENQIHEIATILVEGFVRLRAKSCLPPDRKKPEQEHPSSTQKQLESKAVRSDGWSPGSNLESSTKEKGDAEH